jgi:glycosyltransferase involved in cell wall biosynthesis
VQDGDSSDESLPILQRYQDRLAHFESAPDSGFANAINLGFRHATGEVMAYLNSDDLLLPGTLNYVGNFFAQHPDVDVVYGQRVIVDEYDAEIGRWVLPPHDDDVLSWSDYIPQETLFWRRRIWETAGGGLDESLDFAIDWDLLLRFRKAGAQFVRLPRFLGAFRFHPHQKTSADMATVGQEEMRILRERYNGRPVNQQEAWSRSKPYLLRHVPLHLLYRAGLVRY